MGHAVKLAAKSRMKAGRCLASLAFVIFLAAAFWAGVLWIAALLIHLSGGLGAG